MGIVAFNWAEGNNNQLMLLMNRDNWENRVIRGASWNANGHILSGRCEDNGGTWFGISRGGRVAFLVGSSLGLDYIEPDTGSELYPIEFLESNMSLEDFPLHVAQREAQRHNNGELDPSEGWSYSLIVADMTLNSMVHIWKTFQDDPDIIVNPVPFGVHTISPYFGLDSEASRDLRLRGLFNEMIDDLGNNQLPPLAEIAGRFMYNAEGDQEDGDAVFLEAMTVHPNEQLGRQRLGTTSTTALVVERTGRARVFESDILEDYRLVVKQDAVSAFAGIVAFDVEIYEVQLKVLKS
ncbi:uncharacterized protein LOC110224394 [Arabidopsis lyrata subsp. lyrata]|uniref:uncharacterized protein LOC110224394 n=1 Tax=Arabidopsis lyrata subsp. lyrata TaxID=81972 RepID=UPI000A29E3F7|nr:uncharacterized protein LOC110224394 [Arabidopsis lyrata subsp. lyrata]|eukprot:XP_020866093.1 uncharacterized protein LOC110224394 [Arabidopsis lyrata subsp. lyrata]